MSALGKILNPIYHLISAILAFYYSWLPQYAVAIALLTLTVMILTLPLTYKSTHSMVASQRLQPELNKIRQKYKGDRVRQTEEISALYKANNANPAGGCLPMVLQLPVFIVLYEVIRGLTHTTRHGHVSVPNPKYISHSTLLYQHLVAGHGTMKSFGLDLARSATSVHGGFLAALPYYMLVGLAILLQYIQMHQLMSRNQQSGNNMNQQAQQIQKLSPLLFGFIYISFPAAVTIYFVVSNLSRIVQQTLMYRFDPFLRAPMAVADGTGDSSVIDIGEPPKTRGQQVNNNGRNKQIKSSSQSSLPNKRDEKLASKNGGSSTSGPKGRPVPPTRAGNQAQPGRRSRRSR